MRIFSAVIRIVSAAFALATFGAGASAEDSKKESDLALCAFIAAQGPSNAPNKPVRLTGACRAGNSGMPYIVTTSQSIEGSVAHGVLSALFPEYLVNNDTPLNLEYEVHAMKNLGTDNSPIACDLVDMKKIVCKP